MRSQEFRQWAGLYASVAVLFTLLGHWQMHDGWARALEKGPVLALLPAGAGGALTWYRVRRSRR
jgi:hypothetical protein